MLSLHKTITNNENIIYFTYALKHPLDYTVAFNANFQFGCEKMPALFYPSIYEFLESAKKQMKDISPGFTFTDTTKKTIDGVEFFFIKASLQSLSQDMYVTIRNGYYIYLINAYVKNADKTILHQNQIFLLLTSLYPSVYNRAVKRE